MSTSPVPVSFPCLTFHSGGENRSTVVFSASEKKPITGNKTTLSWCPAAIKQDQLKNMSVCPTTHGYLLARDPVSQATFLWCPQKSSKIELPPLGPGNEEDDDLLLDCTCVLSDKPTAPSCVVLLLQPYHPFLWYCHVRGSNSNNRQWIKHEYDLGTYPDWPDNKILIGPVAARRGKFYFNSEKTGLGVIDFFSSAPAAAPVFGSIANDALSKSYGPAEYVSGRFYLVESNDDLYMVRLRPWIWRQDEETSHGSAGATTVHRMDFPNQRWRKAAHLRGCTFLFSKYYFGASCPDGGKVGLRPDCVYIAWPGRKELEIHNVKDGSIEMQELDESPGSHKIFWVLPADLSRK